MVMWKIIGASLVHYQKIFANADSETMTLHHDTHVVVESSYQTLACVRVMRTTKVQNNIAKVDHDTMTLDISEALVCAVRL